MRRWLAAGFSVWAMAGAGGAMAAVDVPMASIDAQIALHAGKSGVRVLDTGAEALLTRAWLADHAQKTIDVQYFIWSSDNIGILAAEALLRAADRGVQVRVIVDDLLIDAPDKSLLALAQHPKIDIKIYNPKASVGVTLPKRIANVLTDFRGLNQRMHNKTFIVDGSVAITGGRNMAAEYYDYNHKFNFRDRDVLLMGSGVAAMQDSFEAFWSSQLSVDVEDRYNGVGLLKKRLSALDEEVQAVYKDLHAYAQAPENFAPEIRAAIRMAPDAFMKVLPKIVWAKARFVSDAPGKNDRILTLGGGGELTTALAKVVEQARSQITIQSPYLVMSPEAMDLFQAAIERGVKVRISTNSLASTDNIQAFSGYRNQRARLLKMGIEIFEYKPDPVVRRTLIDSPVIAMGAKPSVGLHAKSMVVDQRIAFIGTFNLDPRSENLNTEAGVFVEDAELAKQVESQIAIDMQPENSWNARADDPDQYVPTGKLNEVRIWQALPVKSLL